VAELPLTSAGKIDKKLLRERYENWFVSGPA
jgi:acyl-CoA synthetase (AMP-forming)/AMP-acid ligase II